MDFDLYKNRLLEYLAMKNVHAKDNEQIRCFSPTHQDKNPSMLINKDHFNCFSCGIHGDIYDAVEVLEGITEKKEQFLFLQKIFGGDYVPSYVEEKPTTEKKANFEYDPTACQTLENYLSNHSHKEEAINEFLRQRAFNTHKDPNEKYTDETIKNLHSELFYWPGFEIAQKELGRETLKNAGIPLEKYDTKRSSWDHAGIVLKLATGYKLNYYIQSGCEKRGTKCCQTFPMPDSIENASEIVLVEGEFDALACKASNIPNVYATGGVNGLTEPKIKKYLINDTLKKITFLYDNEESKRGEIGAKKTALKLIKAGFTGLILIAALEEYKDPDEAIVAGRADIVENAIHYAKTFDPTDVPKEKKAAAEKKEIKRGNLPVSVLDAILKRMEITSLEQNDIQGMVSSCINATHETDELIVKEKLRAWGAKEALLKQKHFREGYYLLTLAKKYNLSYYFQKKIEETTITIEELEKFLGKPDKPLVPINFKEIENDFNLKTFIYKRGEMSAAILLTRILQGKFVYVQSEKSYYFFNGLIWEMQPNESGIVYNLLHSIIVHCKKQCDPDDQVQLKALSLCKSKIEEYRFCATVMKQISKHPLIFKSEVIFDGPDIKETLTLLDGVIDFSGNKVRFRNATPNEFRKKQLPYTCDQVREEKTPQKFLDFMKSNFKNDDTLETLMYFLSILPSRWAQFKVGGIFVGVAHTGKTTTMKVISEIYPQMSVPIPREIIMTQRFSNSNGPNPYMARLEGAGFGVSDETKRNDSLNDAMWKQLTGGGELTARGMYAQPRNFKPTAQIIILTNYAPKFDAQDQATIDRMVIIPFAIQHKSGDENTISEDELIGNIRPEFPLVVRHLAEYYIKLRKKHKNKIPLSDECLEHKKDYIEKQETDLHRFVNDNLHFEKDPNLWVPLKEVYYRFCKYYDIELNESGSPLDRNAWQQSKFTRYLKNDYNEVRISQKKIKGEVIQVVWNTKLKDWEDKSPVQANFKSELDFEPNPEPPDEEPF